MADQKTPFHNPFEKLKHLTTTSQPASPAPAAAPPQSNPAPTGPVRSTARAVVRLERAGRGGKDVTVIEQIQISAIERERWLKALKAALGCGGTIEGEAIVLQGDHRVRLPKILTARGVKKVTVG
jgi:translation initiation factor 1